MKDVRGEREPERGIGSEREIGGGRDRDRAEGEVGADRQQRSKERLVRREREVVELLLRYLSTRGRHRVPSKRRSSCSNSRQTTGKESDKEERKTHTDRLRGREV